ncbi:MAG: hypothetical protein ACI935_003527 [Moritella dasanensis]|jgi:hypothetical protein
MRIFKSKQFKKWADKEKLTDVVLTQAIREMENGLIDANLGGHVFKKRISIPGQGKSGGLRTLLAFKADSMSFFMFGFAKNEQDNINKDELKALKLMAKELLSYKEGKLNKALLHGALLEVINNE